MNVNNRTTPAPGENSLNLNQSPDGTLLIQIKGDWKMGNPLPSADEVERELRAGGAGAAHQVRSERAEGLGQRITDLPDQDQGIL